MENERTEDQSTEFDKVLEKLGFTHMTHIMWKHPLLGIIVFNDGCLVENIASTIFKTGERRKLADIKSALDI